MPLFPWRFNRNAGYEPYGNGYGNFQYNGYNPMYYNMNDFYNGQKNFGGNYNEAFNQMVKRNIDAENEKKSEKTNFSKEKEQEFSKNIGSIIVNERNSFLFYEYLRGICDNEKCRRILKKVSDNCKFAQNICSEFYKENFGNEFYLPKSNINETVSFIDGVLWAIEEECDSVFSISSAFDGFLECGRINMILQCKNARVGYLYYIVNQFQR